MGVGDVFVELGGCGFSTHAFWCRWGIGLGVWGAWWMLCVCVWNWVDVGSASMHFGAGEV